MGASVNVDHIVREAERGLSEGAHVEIGRDPSFPSTLDPNSTPNTTTSKKLTLLHRVRTQHSHLPGLRRIPFPAIAIIALVALINIIIWIVTGIILHFHAALISTAALSYTFGLRHALDADHISAIDLMTRRLIASGQRPATVGTFFSLGHSTIVIITSIVVAATAAAVSNKFHGFGTVGGIIGSAVSAAFLLLLGVMNAYILFRLIKQMKKVLNLREGEEEQAWRIEGGGCLFRVLKKMFKIIDKPWKMYPLGVMFGLGFDTSSEIALLGISSIQAAKGTSIWLILIFPVLFTAGMCLIDTIDGALMLTLYILPTERFAGGNTETTTPLMTREDGCEREEDQEMAESRTAHRAKDPVAFLYYSIVLTSLTVMVALIIGTIQLLTLILNVALPSGPFWDGVQIAGDHYEVIGGGICASFVVFGGLSVLCYKPWRRRVEKAKKERLRVLDVQQNSESASVEGTEGNVDGGGKTAVPQITMTDVEDRQTRYIT
jgi:nickel/cobalt transporter (NiCoT) family protein